MFSRLTQFDSLKITITLSGHWGLTDMALISIIDRCGWARPQRLSNQTSLSALGGEYGFCKSAGKEGREERKKTSRFISKSFLAQNNL